MILAIVGEKRCGKDTAWDLMEPSLKGFKRIGLADEIKSIVSNILKIPLPQLEQMKNQESPLLNNGVTARTILQDLGQRLKLNFGKEVWCDLAKNKMVSNENYVITDIRYPFELEYFKEFTDVVALRVERDTGLPKDGHSSETESKKIKVDFTIINNGTMEDFKEYVEDFICQYKLKER